MRAHSVFSLQHIIAVLLCCVTVEKYCDVGFDCENGGTCDTSAFTCTCADGYKGNTCADRKSLLMILNLKLIIRS